jgi:FHS family L-fucose permease-like MFS transporter
MFRGQDGRNHAATFALVSTLFFLWGFCNGMIDVLNKHFRNSLHISNAESGLVQAAVFGAYFVMAIPAGLLARRFGYKGGILIGLSLIATGALWFVPATAIGTFAGFLAGLFVLSSGLTLLETIANPYTTVLGPPEMGATRINLAQTCNAVGAFCGPLLGGWVILSKTGVANTSNSTLYIPYLCIAAVVVVLLVCFALARLPDINTEDDTQAAAPDDGGKAAPILPLWKRWHFTLAVAAQFFYVAAQMGIWGFFITYVTSADMPDLTANLAGWLPSGWTTPQADHFRITDFGASRLFSFGGFGLFILGRLMGSGLLRIFRAHTTLACFGLINSVMMLLIVLRLGWISVAALFLSFFFMSIMYPTIFALGIRGLGEKTKFGSSLIVMAIVGGALMPSFMGWLADVSRSMSIGFSMPLFCFAFVMGYAVLWPRLELRETGHAVAD